MNGMKGRQANNMRLALMQPYFFPYIGYFSIVKQVDRYIVLDTVQYIEHGWIDRNRILKPNGGWQYFGVPTEKHHYTDLIYTVKLGNNVDWRKRILGQLEHYRKKAPYYNVVIDILNDIFSKNDETVRDLNVTLLKEINNYLGINTPVDILSEMNLTIEEPREPDEWGLNVCNAIGGVTEYWNAPGGASFYNRSKYEAAGIKINFQKMILDEYPQKGNTFEPGLSILDVMMFNTPAQITKMINQYELV